MSSQCPDEALEDTASAPGGPSRAVGGLVVGGQEQDQGRETREWGQRGKSSSSGVLRDPASKAAPEPEGTGPQPKWNLD